MINWATGTWTPGDQARYHCGHGRGYVPLLDVFPGLYWYSGLGSGTLFRDDGTMLLNCTPQEGYAEAKRLGLEYRYIDSFITSSFSSVMG